MIVDWAMVFQVCIRLILSALLGGLIGLERGRHGSAAGLRTHILVCVGAAMTSLTGIYVTEYLGYGTDIMRLSAQVISGIGFLGAGMILIRNNAVITGLTTAAGMWTTATIGIAVGFGFYAGAFGATLVCIFCVTVLSHIESRSRKELYVYIELENIRITESIVDTMVSLKDPILHYEVIPPKSGHDGHVGIICRMSGDSQFIKLKDAISSYDVAMIIRTETK